jgi:GH35 family endo-1,4-beta-xylanase
MRHRIAETVLTMLRPDGTPLADADVTVEQTRHAFAFGNIGFDFLPLANRETALAAGQPFGAASLDRLEQLAAQWLELFNSATLPFYWGAFEQERGKPDTERLLATARWFRERDVALKGHPLVWHTVTAPWLRELPTDEVEHVQRERIRRDVGDFAGLIDTWDAINEVVIMPVFDNEREQNGITRLARERGRIATARMAFEEAKAANPSATLLINDFDLSSAYECLLEGLLEAGIPIDAIGLQTHMHQGYWGEEKMLAMVDRFARYGLPLHLTESTLLSGHLMPLEIEDLNDYRIPEWPSTPDGEERQADEIVRHYRSLVSHPSVQAITYWGITDDGAWLGAPVGLIRADGTPKPSFAALRDLIKGEWWLAPSPMRTDSDGRVRVSGFLGDYRVTASGGSASFSITRETTEADARLP